MYNNSAMGYTKRKQMIIVGATTPLGSRAARYYSQSYDCLLLDFDITKLKAVCAKCSAATTYLKFDVTSTVDLVGLVSFLRRRYHFDYALNFLGMPQDATNIALIYKVNLLGTKRLLNYLYPVILPEGAIISISDLGAHLTPISPDVYLLLDDPFAKDFLPKISALSPSPEAAYLFASCGLSNVVHRDNEKWGLKNAHTCAVFHDVTIGEEDSAITTFFQQLEQLLMNQGCHGITLNYEKNAETFTKIHSF